MAGLGRGRRASKTPAEERNEFCLFTILVVVTLHPPATGEG